MGVANSINCGGGTTGQLYASQGAGSPCDLVNNNTTGALQLINTFNFPATGGFLITSVITAAYANYRLIGSGITFGTTGSLEIQLSVNNGSSYVTTGSDYAYEANTYSMAATPTHALLSSGGANQIVMITLVSTSYTVSFVMDVIGPANGNDSAILWNCAAYDGTNSYRKISVGGAQFADAAFNAMKIFDSGGNFSAGVIKAYGL
jgi:hypothetical protein